jgi:hypothetical protein
MLPTHPDGRIVRGAKKDFACSIGYDSGDIVSMWIKGTSNSYMGKLHEIAAVYGVSVDWLRGDTDKKEKPTETNLDGLLPGFDELSEENKVKAREYIELLLKTQQI